MSFTLRKPKRSRYWYARITTPEGRRFERSTKCPKKSDARVVADRWDREACLQDSRVDLTQALTLLREKKVRAQRREGTIERFDMAAGFLLGFFGKDRDIETIKLHDTTKYIDYRRAPRKAVRHGRKVTVRGVSDRSIAIELGHLVSALVRCQQMELYRGHPKAVWPPELAHKARARKRWLPPFEYERLYPHVAPTTSYTRAQRHGTGAHGGAEVRDQVIEHRKPMGQDWREHLATYCHSGMRSGELYIVEAADVSLAGDVVTDLETLEPVVLDHGANLPDGTVIAPGHSVPAREVPVAFHVRGYKTAHATDAADRIVPVHRAIRPIIARRMLERPEGPLFPLTSPSLKAQQRQFLRALGNGCERAGIERVNENDLRRTFASWCKISGVAESTVVDWLGHTSSRMVREVYGRSDIPFGLREMAKMERLAALPLPTDR